MTTILCVASIDQPVTFACPHCAHALLVATAQALDTPGRQAWLFDGDTLPVRDRLSAAQRERAYDAHFMVGTCPACEGEYQVVDLTLLAGIASEAVRNGSDAERQAFNYLVGNQVGEGQVYATCRSADPTPGLPPFWLLTRSTTPYGVLDRHSLGPFKIDADDAVHTPFGIGVCAAGGSPAIAGGVAVVVALWDAALRLNTEVQPVAA